MLKGRTPLLLAGGLSLLALLLVYQTMDYKEKMVLQQWSLVPVVVADRALSSGTIIDWDMAKEHKMPKKFVTPSIVKPEQFKNIIGQKLLAPLRRGDPLLWSHLQAAGLFEGLSNIVTKKGRAISIMVAGASSVAGWVRPNDHVDILGTFMDPKTNQMVTVTLLQNIIILATGNITGDLSSQIIEKDDREYTSVTILVIPEEAEIVVLAAQMGKLHLSLRNLEDIGSHGERGRATIETLLTGERVRALQRKREKTFRIIYPESSGGGN